MANLRNKGYIGSKGKNNTSTTIHNNSSSNNNNLVAILGLISDTRGRGRSLLIQIHSIILSNNRDHTLNSSSNSNNPRRIFHLEPTGQTMVHHPTILAINNNSNILPYQKTLLFLQKMMR